jgi:hypothetical protein
MAKLFPSESATGDDTVGGFVVQFPSGAFKSVAWRSQAPIPDTKETAKEYAIALTQHMLDAKLIDDLERTNMPSLVAAIQKIILDWNEKRRAALHARNPMLQALDATPQQ